MPRLVTPAVLLPRFTTLVHTGASLVFYTLPIDASGFERGFLTCWRGAVLGTGSAFGFQFLESTDRDAWAFCDGTSTEDPGPGAEQQYEFPISKRWFRLGAQLGGTGAVVTCWSQGYFVNRGP
jgi:hypothetical protein